MGISKKTLDRLQIGQSPLTGRVYVGIPNKDGYWEVKTDFTDRLHEFAPQLFKRSGGDGE